MSEFIQRSLSGWVVARRPPVGRSRGRDEGVIVIETFIGIKKGIARAGRQGRHCNPPPIYMSGTCSRFADLNGTVTVGNALP